MPALMSWVAVCVFALAILPMASAFAQGGAGVKTDENDVTIVIGGEFTLDAVMQDEFFRGGGRDKRGYWFAAARLRIDFDFRVGADTGIFASLATNRRESDAAFGTDYPRTRGMLLGQDNLDVEIDELFLEVQRLFNLDLAARVGQSHIQLGLDTEEEKLWDGHGRLFFDTDCGRGPIGYFDRMHPVGVQARYKPTAFLAATGYLSWVHRIFATDDRTVFAAAVEAETTIDESYKIFGGYMRWFDQSGPDIETTWFGAKLILGPQLEIYGETAFQVGNGFSGEALFGGVRFTLAAGEGFVDVSGWLLTGDDPATPTKFEGFRSFGSVRTTMIVDSIEYGMGRHSNVTAIKFVGVYRLTYNLLARLVYARYAAQHSETSPRPGDEIDAWLMFDPDLHTRIQAGVGYVFGSRIHGENGNPDAIMVMISITSDF